MFLDDRKEEEGLWRPSSDDVSRIKSEISSGVEFETTSRALLRRRAEIISKCYSKLDNQYPELIQNLVQFMN